MDGRRTRGEATRARLIAAAREQFGARGYEGTSIGDLLAASGVARGALYHHFDGKAELFDAVAETLFAEIAASTSTAAQDGTTTLENLRAGAHAWLEMARDPGIQRIVLLDAPTILGWARWRALDERHSLGGLRASLRRLAREGFVPQGQEELLARMLLAALNEAALFLTSTGRDAARLEQTRASVDLLIDRLVTPETARPARAAETGS